MTTKRRRSKPRWTQARIRRELEEFLQGATEWPSYRDFQRSGRQTLRDEVTRSGGPERWAAEFGLPLQNLKSGSKRALTDERIEAELRSFMDGRDTWPTRREFERAGSVGLATAVYHHGVTAYWARRLGFQAPPRAGVGGRRLWSDERIRAELEDFCRGRTTWPTEREFLEAGKSKLYNAVCHYGGPPHWAAELGLIRSRRHGPAPGSRSIRSNRSQGVAR